MKIIKHREIVEHVALQRVFEWDDRPGSGFAFACNQAGEPVSLTPVQAGSWAFCAEQVTAGKMSDLGVRLDVSHHVEPAIGRCDCGDEVVLGGFTCTCRRCGTDYNSAGQRLAPRSQWGEETGETASDILMAEAAGFPEVEF